MTTAPTWTPADATLNEFTAYTFTTVGTDLDIGGTITGYTWNFGDGSANVTTLNPTVTYAYTTQGTFNLQVEATNNSSQTGVFVGTPMTIVAGTNPFTLTPTSPAAAATELVQVGASNSIVVNFSFQVADTDGGTIAAAGILLNPGDATATVGTPVNNGGGAWTVPVTYLPAAAAGLRTATATVQVQDSLVIRSTSVSFPTLTIQTYSGVDTPPLITMVATPTIPAGTNSTWQGVPVAFVATAVDPLGNPLSYTWTFSDGGNGDVASTPNASALNQTHTFAAAGVYPVTFTASDGLPGNGAKSITLSMSILANTPPVVSFTQNPTGNPYAYEPVSFTASVTDANPVTLTWDFGDTTSGTGTSVTHSYSAAGGTTVTLTANDGMGGVTTASTTFTVLANLPSVAAVTSVPATLYQSKVYTFTAAATDANVGGSLSTFQWNFGDGTPIQVSAAVQGVGGAATSSITHTFASSFSGTAAVSVQGVDSHGAVGSFSPIVNFPVVATSLPVVAFTAPMAPVSLNVAISGTVSQTFTFTASNPQLGQPGDSGPIPVGNITFASNDPQGTAGAVTSLGGNSYSVTVTYSGAAAAGTRTSTPTAYATDTLSIQGVAASAQLMTVQTQTAATTPTIAITSPTSATTTAYSSVAQTLNFTLTNADNAPLSYTVNWGDGSPAFTATTATSTQAGVAVSLSHTFPDSFALVGTVPTPATATVSISCTDNRTPAATASKGLAFAVIYNSYPGALITSPQASATTPAAVTAAVNAWAAAQVPPIAAANIPAVVILPLNGKATFVGTGSFPGYELTSQTGNLSYNWSFPGGVTSAVPSASTSSLASPGQVTFAGTANQVTPYLVTLTVTDDLGRVSSADPTQASPLNTAQQFQTTFQRLVVVDGIDSQLFTMSFLYRQRSGTSAPDTYSLATLANHGFGSAVQIYQDGISNTYTVASGSSATTQIPVRSDVPFWLSIPAIAGDTSDPASYMVSIPNLPGLDPDLQVGNPAITTPMTLSAALGTGFAFASATAPWDPQLQITTGSGFGSEGGSTVQREFIGSSALDNNYCNATPGYDPEYRWIDRLSIPLANPLLNLLPVNTEWNQTANDIHSFSGLSGYQGIPEWFVIEKATATRDWNDAAATPILGAYGTASGPNALGFTVADSYNVLGASSTHLSVSALEVFRAPASTLDPFNFDVMKSTSTTFVTLDDSAPQVPGSTVGGVNPTAVTASPLSFLSGLVNTPPSSFGTPTPLSGGISQVKVIYNANDVNRIPNTSSIYTPFTDFGNFGYAEYLWTSAWARPLVLNCTNLSYYDSHWGYFDFSPIHTDTSAADECGSATESVALPWFFYSDPASPWPSATGVQPDGSNYNMNVVNGGTFDASSPVSVGATAASSTAVGRFFWTAYTPRFNASNGGLISRTWLADGSGNPNQIPVSFPSAGVTDATTAWGFLPPQDVMVDKRTRINGIAQASTLGGYRVIWYNPTQNTQTSPNSNVVAPDFWAVEIANPANTTYPTQIFLLSANYPRTGQSITNPLVTDEQAFLPSNALTFQTNDIDGPGYCWFDVPTELQPSTGQAVTVTVFALKSILKNNPVSSARIINRSEWVEAVKTVTANVSVVVDTNNQSFAHKIPFNYPWDIVVVNSPVTQVSGN